VSAAAASEGGKGDAKLGAEFEKGCVCRAVVSDLEAKVSKPTDPQLHPAFDVFVSHVNRHLIWFCVGRQARRLDGSSSGGGGGASGGSSKLREAAAAEVEAVCEEAAWRVVVGADGGGQGSSKSSSGGGVESGGGKGADEVPVLATTAAWGADEAWQELCDEVGSAQQSNASGRGTPGTSLRSNTLLTHQSDERRYRASRTSSACLRVRLVRVRLLGCNVGRSLRRASTR